MPINMNAARGITHQDEFLLKGSTPTLRFTDTDTGADSYLTASSTGGALSLMADSGSESNTTKIYFACDGDEVGHFRGNNAYVGSFRLFPVKRNSTDQGIFFGTEASDGTGDWSNTRVMSMDTSEVVHLYPGSNSTGALQLKSANGHVETAANLSVGSTLYASTIEDKGADMTIINAHNDAAIWLKTSTGSSTYLNFKVHGAGHTETAGNHKIGGALQRTYTTVTHSSNTHTCDLSVNDNFIINANAATNTIAMTIADANIGQSGNIVIVNASSGTVAFAALPSYMLTPDSATVNFVTTNSAVSLFSYLVISDDDAGNRRVLVNYVGNFG